MHSIVWTKEVYSLLKLYSHGGQEHQQCLLVWDNTSTTRDSLLRSQNPSTAHINPSSKHRGLLFPWVNSLAYRQLTQQHWIRCCSSQLSHDLVWSFELKTLQIPKKNYCNRHCRLASVAGQMPGCALKVATTPVVMALLVAQQHQHTVRWNLGTGQNNIRNVTMVWEIHWSGNNFSPLCSFWGLIIFVLFSRFSIITLGNSKQYQKKKNPNH